jgi:aspartate dehydrogenase
MKRAKVGIIGCGTIGSAVAKAVAKRFSRYAVVAYICDRNKEKAIGLRNVLGRSVKITSVVHLIRMSDVVIEAASPVVAADVVPQSLKLGKKVVVMSVGGLLGVRNLFDRVRKSRGRVWVPSGAITGVDGLMAASQAKVRSVRLVTRKPPKGLCDAPYFEKRRFPVLHGKEERCVFKGSALQAARAFPQNINVAAVLSLAGLGPQRTQVEIWTSHAYRFNQHEVSVEGDFGSMKTVTTNIPSPENPKTSYLAILSLIALLKEIFSSIEIGS